MAQEFMETAGAKEGSDPLKEWLGDNKDQLRLQNSTKLEEIYDKLSEEIAYDDLIKLGEADLRPALSDCRLKSIQVGRIIALLKETPETIIHKEANKSKIVKIVLSHDEEDALQNISKQRDKIDSIILNITNELNQSMDNAANGKQIINKKCEQMIAAVNEQRKNLLFALDNKINIKAQKLEEKKKQFIGYKSKLDEYCNKAETLVHNTTITPTQRKQEILALTPNVINKPVLNYTVGKSSINVSINADEVKNMITNMCKIEEIHIPKPPTIDIISAKQRSVQIKIHGTKTIMSSCVLKYKIEYVQIQDTDDIKSIDELKHDLNVNWKSNNVNDNTSGIYIINGLKSSSNYVVRVAAKNIIGWSDFSKLISFKTEKFRMEFDLIYQKYRKYILDNGMVVRRLIVERKNLDQIVYFSVCSSTKFDKNIHEFRIECINPGDDSIGIMSNTNICKFKNKYHHKANANVYYWRNVTEYSALSFSAISGLYCGNLTKNKRENKTQSSNIPKWKENDMVMVRVDCNVSNVTFFLNDKQIGNKMNIVPNVPYHAFIGTRTDDTEYKLHGHMCFKN